jgi:hypothetical protein
MQFTKEGRTAKLSELCFYPASLRVLRNSCVHVIPTTLLAIELSLFYALLGGAIYRLVATFSLYICINLSFL